MPLLFLIVSKKRHLFTAPTLIYLYDMRRASDARCISSGLMFRHHHAILRYDSALERPAMPQYREQMPTPPPPSPGMRYASERREMSASTAEYRPTIFTEESARQFRLAPSRERRHGHDDARRYGCQTAMLDAQPPRQPFRDYAYYAELSSRALARPRA